jgi:hypothetical protein
MHLLIPFAAPLSRPAARPRQRWCCRACSALLAGAPMRSATRPTSSACRHRTNVRWRAPWGWAGGSGLLPWAAARQARRRRGHRRPGLGPADARALAPGHRTGQPDRPGAARAGRGHLARRCSTPCCRCSPATASCCAGARRCAGTWRTKAWPACHRLAGPRDRPQCRPPGWAATPRRAVRRLQSEVQMLLHTHPLNDEREARACCRSIPSGSAAAAWRSRAVGSRWWTSACRPRAGRGLGGLGQGLGHAGRRPLAAAPRAARLTPCS